MPDLCASCTWNAGANSNGPDTLIMEKTMTIPLFCDKGV
jgi:hypothetical protein